MSDITVRFEDYHKLREIEHSFKLLEGSLGKDKVKVLVYEAKLEKEIETFLDSLDGIMAEAEVDYPAGEDSYPRISYDTDLVKECLEYFAGRVEALREENE